MQTDTQIPVTQYKPLILSWNYTKNIFNKIFKFIYKYRKNIWSIFVISLEATGCLLIAYCVKTAKGGITINGLFSVYVNEEMFHWGVKILTLSFIIKITSVFTTEDDIKKLLERIVKPIK